MIDSVDMDEYMNDIEKASIKNTEPSSEMDDSEKEQDGISDSGNPIIEPDVYC